jgi:ArsR family transcriptional regulator
VKTRSTARIDKPHRPTVADDFPALAEPIDDGTLERISQLFKQLADKSRLKILLALARVPELHVSALCEQLEQSQPAVSHHLHELRHSKLVEFRREGKFNFYRLDSGILGELITQLFQESEDGRRIRFGPYALQIQRPRAKHIPC